MVKAFRSFLRFWVLFAAAVTLLAIVLFYRGEVMPRPLIEWIKTVTLVLALTMAGGLLGAGGTWLRERWKGPNDRH